MTRGLPKGAAAGALATGPWTLRPRGCTCVNPPRRATARMPRAANGFLVAKGPHAGDLPNIHVPSGGRLAFEYFANGVPLGSGARSLLEQDGSALVPHAKPDDYRTDPAGAAGDGLACGVIQKQ